MSSPADAPLANISIPPAVASIFIASAADSVADNTIEPPVFVIFISSVAAPTASISIPPAEATIRIASTAFSEDAILTWRAPSISTPPALAVRFIASAVARAAESVIPPAVDSRFTLSAPVPCAEISVILSEAPPLAVTRIAPALFSVDVILMLEPVATMSMSSPAEAPEARMSIPPADAAI